MTENPHLPADYRQRLAEMDYNAPAQMDLGPLITAIRGVAHRWLTHAPTDPYPTSADLMAFAQDVTVLCDALEAQIPREGA